MREGIKWHTRNGIAGGRYRVGAVQGAEAASSYRYIQEIHVKLSSFEQVFPMESICNG